MKVGLRIDVDTYRGTRLGVPALCDVLADHGVRGSFFFTVGPDNMGRHLRRLVRPTFLVKMLRTRATSLYGWDILLRGTLWPGPVIGSRLADTLRRTVAEGHEAGLHAWDHHAWQTRIASARPSEARDMVRRGFDALADVLGRPPIASAAPAWRCPDAALLAKSELPFRYGSDCRGHSLFRPRVQGRVIGPPQVPTTLPTYDEMVGRDGVTDANYNELLLDRVRQDGLNVLTIHAEVEGIARRDLFDRFLALARARGVELLPLGRLVDDVDIEEESDLVRTEVRGRDGWISSQRTEPSGDAPSVRRAATGDEGET